MTETTIENVLPVLSLAPMEGVTGWQLRRLIHTHFGGADRFYTPFITPAERISGSSRFGREINPEHNEGMHTIPQVLTNDAEGFLETAKQLSDFGYTEVNLNLGCPSGTVVKKKRGSGFLACPEELDRFLETVMSNAPVSVSVKTRIGVKNPEEFSKLVSIYRKYPFSEVIVHPRVREEQYEGAPHLDAFSEAYETLSVPVVYNGNVNSPDDLKKIMEKYPKLSGVMLGRGAVGRPDLFREIRTGKPAEPSEIRQFHEELYTCYLDRLGAKNTLFKMKELWFFMRYSYAEPETVWNRIRRSKTNAEFLAVASDILSMERPGYAYGIE